MSDDSILVAGRAVKVTRPSDNAFAKTQAQASAASATLAAQYAAAALASANNRIYASQGAGEAATTTGQYFWVAASSTLTLYIRTGGGSTLIAVLPYLDSATGNLLVPTGKLGVGVTPTTKVHFKDGNAEVVRIETTTARGGGNLFQSWHDPTGRKGYIGYGAASDNFTLLNELNADFRLGTNNAFRWQIVSVGHLAPFVDNTYDIGGGALRARTIYATTGSINTSDAREKAAIRAFTAPELAAAKRIAGEIGVFQFLNGMREHVGVIAQTVWAIMADEGLIDPVVEGERPSSRYAFLCYDEWEAEEDREITAGNRFGIRPDQLALFLIAAQEARLAALEAAL